MCQLRGDERMCIDDGGEVERLEFERAVLEQELTVFTEEPARVAHPDDDWGEWPYKKR